MARVDTAKCKHVGRPREMGSPGAMDTVVVIGAGVSGCACAATLANEGVPVLVLNSALDSVGQPSLGPDVACASGEWSEIADVLGALPSPLRDVWVASATATGGGRAFFAVDRRMVSIETKRVLEQMDGLKFRQALVTGLRRNRDAGAQSLMVVETAFGESISADVVVVAVGLGLGGVVRVGAQALPGGRYGETPAPELRTALDEMGVAWSEVGFAVGARFAGKEIVTEDHGGRDGDAQAPTAQAANARRQLRLRTGRPLAGCWPLFQGTTAEDSPGRVESRWPSDYPAAPHWLQGLRDRAFGWLDECSAAAEEGPSQLVTPGAIPCLVPDGAATGEVYVRPSHGGLCGAAGARGPVPTRLAQQITGLVVSNVDGDGKLVQVGTDSAPVWIVGKAAGAGDYLQSLLSGVRAGTAIARYMASFEPATTVDAGEDS